MIILLDPNWRSTLCRTCPTCPGELDFWVASHPEATFDDLWEEVIDPTWLPFLAKAGGATHYQEIVRAMCDVAKLCLHLIPVWESRPSIAIETTEAWFRSEATLKQVKKSIKDADKVYYDGTFKDTTESAVLSVCNINSYIYSTVRYAVAAGIESQLICTTIRNRLVFERPPRPKRLTIWQRLAVDD